MPVYTQDNMRVTLNTPLGKDVLLLRGFRGQEGVSRPFQFELDLYSENRSIALSSALGKPATIKMALSSGSFAFLNGYFSSFTQGGTELVETGKTSVTMAAYRATLVPWLWFLTCTRDCRIFQNKTVPEIIQQIFQDLGFSDFQLQLTGSFNPREYCVQYRESDFNFVSRLMEEEGIFYFFEHQETKHSMVLANHPSGFKPSPTCPTVFYRRTESGFETEELVKEWDVRQTVRPGQYMLRDFNFETPLLDLTSSLSGKDERHYEVYDYPGEYTVRGEGDRLSRIRMEEEETPLFEIQGSSNCLGFSSGFRFELKDHYRRDVNKNYVLTRIQHQYDQANSFRSAANQKGPLFEYRNQFHCVPYPVPFRPPRVTPIPVVHGSQTAIVVGPPGEEIHVDKYGRVKVQFHWDREGKYDDKSSCWVRVSQNWAGKGWGVMMLPRIGQEVIVDFLEGDPDQPIITGRVYNGESMPPYNLPDEKTKSAIKSYSSKGGGGFNEIRFEDKKGSEQLFMHGEKDFDLRVKNDRREWIGNDRHLYVKRDKVEQIDRDEHALVAGHHQEEIKQDYHLKVGGKQAIEIGTSRSLKVGTNLAENTGMNYYHEAGQQIHLKSGMTVVIEAGVQLTLKVGGNFVDISPMGVTIQGTLVNINSGGAAGVGSGGQLVSPAAPNKALIADNADPGSKEPTFRQQMAALSGIQAALAAAPAHAANPQKTHWIEIEMVDEDNKPVPGEPYAITLPDGSVASGTLDEKGFARIEGLDPGTCQVAFTNRGKDEWKPK